MNTARAVLISTFAATSAPAQNCAPFWAGVDSPAVFGRYASSKLPAVVVFDDGSGPALYGKADFNSGPPPRSRVMRWRGGVWESLLEGWPLGVSAPDLRLLDFGEGMRLCAITVQGSPLPYSRLWVWTGSKWVDGPEGMVVPGGPFPHATAYESGGPRTYGRYGTQLIAWRPGRLDQWDVIGQANNYIGISRALDLGDGSHLYIGGGFTTINGQSIQGIAKWTGSTWEPLGSGICGWHVERDMNVYDDGMGPKLYASDVVCADGQPINRIAKYDPKSRRWSDVGGGGIVTNGIVEVYSVGGYTDANGPSLFAGGIISMAGGGVPVRLLARFNGTTWDNAMGGVGGTGFPYDFTPFDDGTGMALYVSGGFNQVGAGGPGATLGMVKWVGCPNCYANCDFSTVSPRLNVRDFSCFINRFTSLDPYADCDASAVIDIADFGCFLQKFAAGCT